MEGMKLINSGKAAKASKVFEDSLTKIDMLDKKYADVKDKAAVPSITWALRNGLGLALMHGRYPYPILCIMHPL